MRTTIKETFGSLLLSAFRFVLPQCHRGTLSTVVIAHQSVCLLRGINDQSKQTCERLIKSYRKQLLNKRAFQSLCVLLFNHGCILASVMLIFLCMYEKKIHSAYKWISLDQMIHQACNRLAETLFLKGKAILAKFQVR